MWHMEIQEGQLADVRRTVQEQAEAARRSLQMRADEQLRQEKEAYRKAERNRLLRIRWAAPARGPVPRPFPAGAPPPPLRSPGPTHLPASPASPARFPLPAPAAAPAPQAQPLSVSAPRLLGAGRAGQAHQACPSCGTRRPRLSTAPSHPGPHAPSFSPCQTFLPFLQIQCPRVLICPSSPTWSWSPGSPDPACMTPSPWGSQPFTRRAARGPSRSPRGAHDSLGHLFRRVGAGRDPLESR